MPSDITASVSEPVRVKRPTLYGSLFPSELDDAMRAGSHACVCFYTNRKDGIGKDPPDGTVLITIPGEDDAPSGADPLPWKVQHKGGGIVAAFAWSDQANAYRERGAACGGWSASELEVVNTTPPGAKK